MAKPYPPENFIPTPSKVEGIEVYMPAPAQAAPQAEVVEFTCPRCGATTAYNPASGSVTCAHCGYHEELQKAAVGRGAEEFEFTVETMDRAAQGWGLERKDLECQNCGAITSAPAEMLTHTCASCGSNKVIQRAAAQDVLRPRFLIPFKIEAQDCTRIARGWLGSSWMTPRGLQALANSAAFTGMYLPFWTFDATTAGDWKAEVGHQETERYFSNGEWKTRTVTRWRWESGRAQLAIDDLVVDGARRVSGLLMSRVKNYDMGELCEYDPKYLAGMQAQAYDIPLEEAWESGRQEMRDRTRQACREQASTGQIRNFSMSLDFAGESWRYILLPVYLASYPYENKPYQVVVNGQTGAIAGQRPVDWTRVWLAAAALVAPGLLLGLLGLLTTPLGGIGAPVGVIGFVLLVIGLVIAIILLRQAYGMDDA